MKKLLSLLLLSVIALSAAAEAASINADHFRGGQNLNAGSLRKKSDKHLAQLVMDLQDDKADLASPVFSGNVEVASVIVDGVTSGSVIFPSLSTAERDTYTPVAGMVLFNKTTNKLQVYDGTVWADLH